MEKPKERILLHTWAYKHVYTWVYRELFHSLSFCESDGHLILITQHEEQEGSWLIHSLVQPVAFGSDRQMPVFLKDTIVAAASL